MNIGTQGHSLTHLLSFLAVPSTKHFLVANVYHYVFTVDIVDDLGTITVAEAILLELVG